MTENNTNNTFKQVYKSTGEVPFEIWFAPKEAEVKYPFTEIAPEPSIKAPIFIWEGQKWVENTEVSQAAQLNDLKQTVTQIKNANSNNATNLSDLAKNQAKLLQMLTPKIVGKPAAPSATTTPTTPQVPTDGGNK
ncbi:hypothetical protein SAMN04487792_1569 [Lactobacillus bombicola]|uniref:Uncharacterized protein n=1 Tax=Lactobacillus bombicola TaxID=1505723 RepID=A0A1I1TQ52_9LACO|nr:hypothetical protein [Lactobacillus bombicola]SFD60876.1 hypothetical protein SAMN04487792_1569 [Lactobacillus bombicola]